MRSLGKNANWFETQNKMEVKNNKKRTDNQIKMELDYTMDEMKKRRFHKLKELYDYESACYEDELANLGLAIIKER